MDGPIAGYDTLDGRQYCCCGKVHVETGTRIIAYLGAIGIVFKTISLIAEISSGSSREQISGSIISLALTAVCIACLFHALRTENEKYLAPYLICMGLSIAVYFIMILFLIVIFFTPRSDVAKSLFDELFNPTKYKTEDERVQVIRIFCVFMTFLMGLMAAVSGWLFNVVYRFHTYLKQRRLILIGAY